MTREAWKTRDERSWVASLFVVSNFSTRSEIQSQEKHRLSIEDALSDNWLCEEEWQQKRKKPLKHVYSFHSRDWRWLWGRRLSKKSVDLQVLNSWGEETILMTLSFILHYFVSLPSNIFLFIQRGWGSSYFLFICRPFLKDSRFSVFCHTSFFMINSFLIHLIVLLFSLEFKHLFLYFFSSEKKRKLSLMMMWVGYLFCNENEQEQDDV